MALLRVSGCMFAVSVVLLVTPVGAGDGDVRLVNGPNPYEGRVEYSDGVFLGLCLPYVDSGVPMVICRQLGYPVVGAMMYYGPSYGAAPGEIYRRGIYCSGSEATLSACTMVDQDVNCDPINTLGVSCNTNITVSQTVRLLGGTSQYEGRLEVFVNGIWGTVCRNEGDQYIYHHINARAACRKLFGQGYGGSYFPAYETPSRFGILQSGAIHRYSVQCKGDETNLLDCPYSAAGSSCDHEQDATLKCYPVPQGCGGYLTGSSGTFQSPVYPDGQALGHDTVCVWTITVTQSHTIRLSITITGDDELARASNRLDVIDTSGYSSMASTTGSPVPSLISSGNVIYVRLTTSKNSTGIKFNAIWNIPCDTNFTSTAQDIRSPGYYYYYYYYQSGVYAPNLDCTYFIQQRAEFTVRITFNEFSLDATSSGPCLDFLTVYDGESESAPKLGGPYCGGTMPPVLTSTQNVVMIKFHSDGNTSSSSSGFYLSYAGQEPEPIVIQLTSNSGTFQSPDYPNLYNNETDYIWNITAPKRNQVVVLTFSDFLMNNCYYYAYYSYLEVKDFVSGSNLGSLCNKPSAITSSSHVMYVRFVSTPTTSGLSGGKFKASWTTVSVTCDKNSTSTYGNIQSPGYPTAYPPNVDCTYFIQQRSEYTVTLTVYAFAIDEKDNGACLDFLTIYDGDSESAQVLGGPYCGRTIPPVLTSKQNVVMIKFHSDGNTSSTSRGYQLIFAEKEPDPIVKQLTSDFGTIQSPGYPIVYNNETDYIWTITASRPYKVIVLTFSDFDINNINTCSSNLQIRDYYSYGSELATLCGSGLPTPVTSSSPVMYMRLISTPATSGMSGSTFNASWTTECRQRLTASSGTITSPEYPSPYPTDMNCISTIVITQIPGYVIKLSFSSFQLDDAGEDGLCQDYIEVRDGSFENSDLIGEKYCGTSFPPSLTSTQNSMFIRFVSDNVTSANSSGFMASYLSYEKECEGKMMTEPTGDMYSPGYPNFFPWNSYCIWTVTVDPGYVIELKFNSFSVGKRNRECSYAYVRLYDSDTVDADTVIDTFCGTGDIPKIATRRNSLTVVLNSFYPDIYTASGFHASYRAIETEDAEVSISDLIPYGYNQGDVRAQLSGSAMQKVTLHTEFRYGSEKYQDVYIGTNGVVSIGNSYPWPNLPNNSNVICAYCAYIDDSDSVGGIFYHQYGGKASDAAILKRASRDVHDFSDDSTDFEATVAVVVTWDRVKRGRYSAVDFRPENEIGEATFQLVLVSDGLTSYVLLYYLTGAMTWTHHGSWSYVILGYSNGKEGDYHLNLYSRTTSVYSFDAIVGNTGRKGLWIYKVGEAPPNPVDVCLQWFFWNVYFQDVPAMKQRFDQLPSCPCSGRDVWRKVRYLWTRGRTDSVNKIQCYQLNEASSHGVYPYGKECCYSYDMSDPVTYDQLIMDPPYAGSALAYSPTYPSLRVMYERERTAHTACCLSGIKAEYCTNGYYDIRPIGVCRADIPFQFAWLWGDPHITTLDEREYTFNGWGEYTLVTLTTSKLNFTLQGRMERTQLQNGTHFNGTVFTAFGVKENRTTVFVGLHPIKKDALEIYVDGQDYSRLFQQEGEEFLVESGNFTVFSDNGSFVVSFRSGITLAVAMGIRSLAMTISLPLEFRTKTKGLLGNYNGVKGDDFVLPDGTVLSDSMSDRDIHFKFGQKWAVTAQNTVLRYGPREGPASFSNTEFIPVFLDELSPDGRQAAEELCGSTDTACIYDFVVTGSEAFALDTKKRTQQMRKDNAESKNTLPVLDVPANVRVTLGQPVTFKVTARDPDAGDSVTYRIVDNAGDRITVDASTGQITVNIDKPQSVHIRIFATDSSKGQSVVRTVPIILCTGCNDHGECDFTRTRESVGTFFFQHAVCVCRGGWTGDDCDEDRDACLDNQCDPLQTCTDLSPSQQDVGGAGYLCSDCPAGYSMDTDGSHRCLDVDECRDARLNGCAQGCENTYGSYTCSCTSGYRLSSDASSCLDVNECAEKSDNCQQVCSNTVGGFRCLCEPGYTYDSVRNACDQTPATREVCQNKNCSQGCRAVTNPSTNLPVPQCFCRAGYDLDSVDGVTCKDHDECQDGLCAQVCTNIVGGFACSCYSGHLLNNDQRTCSPCPSLTYGPGCSLNCSCSGRGVACHAVTGCVCQEGWTGSECRNDVDECARNPDVCGRDKVCSNKAGSFACTCRPGYTLTKEGTCADIDECAAGTHTCGELQKCTNTPGSFFCTCLPGYRVDNGSCVDINECSVNPRACQQRCFNTEGSFNCDCYYGYTLNTDRSTCAKVSDPCRNVTSCGHGCTLDDEDREVCFCHNGYRLLADGHNCLDVNECTAGIVSCSHTCGHSEGAFACYCPSGMRLSNNGTTCEDCPKGTYGTDCVHTCNCGAGADHCDAITGCVCKKGWSGDACTHDVNECMTSASQECQEKDAECVNLLGGFKCVCREGFEMDEDGNCQDVDECANNPPCSQQCENLPGSFRCLCSRGFSFDNATGECKDIDECRLASTHSCTQRCHNYAGSYRCSCRAGYTLDNNGHTCTAQTSCSRTDCDSVHGGCFVENEQAKCFCNIGYRLGEGNTCSFEAVDWCAEDVCDQQCRVSLDGTTFACSCAPGHMLNDDQRTCRVCREGTYGPNCASNCTCNIHRTESCDPVTGACKCRRGLRGATCSDDINECALTSPRACPSPQSCQNTAGSYFCICPAGYDQQADGSCKECEHGSYGKYCEKTCNCPSENVESCDKVTGTCHCKAGWEGGMCDLDVDECVRGLHTCSARSHETCQNTPGAFTCVCRDGFNEDANGVCVGKSTASSLGLAMSLPLAFIMTCLSAY